MGGTTLLIPGGLLAGSGTVLAIAGLASLADYGVIGVLLGVPFAVLGTVGVI
ncbi:hypothetical protein [Sunxiuqinia indica]|uniref:hypothetical protein n=1 Tax=Sunxiuqinia indica TaxID=2692584 RepID=UPI001357E2A9|nr:hypothetical protein [Sunxiuqinia indica]